MIDTTAKYAYDNVKARTGDANDDKAKNLEVADAIGGFLVFRRLDVHVRHDGLLSDGGR